MTTEEPGQLKKLNHRVFNADHGRGEAVQWSVKNPNQESHVLGFGKKQIYKNSELISTEVLKAQHHDIRTLARIIGRLWVGIFLLSGAIGLLQGPGLGVTFTNIVLALIGLIPLRWGQRGLATDASVTEELKK